MAGFIARFLIGLVIGVAAITAGAGTFAIVFGIYDRCMEIIARPFKNFKKNLVYVTPIVLGICISALLCSGIVIYLLNNYNAYVKYTFLGIVLGGVPELFQRANAKGKNKKYWIAFGLAFIFTIIITYLGNKIESSSIERTSLGFIELFIYGAIYAFGAVMPGMTTIHILMFMGVLSPIMAGILGLNMSVIIPFGIGYLLVVLATANLITYLFKKFYGYTYYAIIGFSVTSLLMLVPPLHTLTERIVCPILAIVATLAVYNISKLDLKVKEKRNENDDSSIENNIKV